VNQTSYNNNGRCCSFGHKLKKNKNSSARKEPKYNHLGRNNAHQGEIKKLMNLSQS
jgi:hypothetical protein